MGWTHKNLDSYLNPFGPLTSTITQTFDHFKSTLWWKNSFFLTSNPEPSHHLSVVYPHWFLTRDCVVLPHYEKMSKFPHGFLTCVFHFIFLGGAQGWIVSTGSAQVQAHGVIAVVTLKSHSLSTNVLWLLIHLARGKNVEIKVWVYHLFDPARKKFGSTFSVLKNLEMEMVFWVFPS